MIDKRIYDLDYIRELQARYKTDYYTLLHINAGNLWSFMETYVKVARKSIFYNFFHDKDLNIY